MAQRYQPTDATNASHEASLLSSIGVHREGIASYSDDSDRWQITSLQNTSQDSDNVNEDSNARVAIKLTKRKDEASETTFNGYCPVHHDKKAELYCNDCDCDKIACLECFDPGSRHYNHRVSTLKGVCSKITSDYEELLNFTSEGSAKAIERLREKERFDEEVLNDVMQSLCKIDKEIDETIQNLGHIRVALHAAVQRVAQTLRSKAIKREQLVESVWSTRVAGRKVKEIQELLRRATIPQLVQHSSESHGRWIRLLKALKAQILLGTEEERDLSVGRNFANGLEALNKSGRFLRESTSNLVSSAAMKVRSHNTN
jgi:hypothetical protein